MKWISSFVSGWIPRLWCSFGALGCDFRYHRGARVECELDIVSICPLRGPLFQYGRNIFQLFEFYHNLHKHIVGPSDGGLKRIHPCVRICSLKKSTMLL